MLRLASGQVGPFHEWVTGVALIGIHSSDMATCPTLHAPPLMGPQGVVCKSLTHYQPELPGTASK